MVDEAVQGTANPGGFDPVEPGISRPRRRRVLHCIGSLGPGGAERQLCNLAVASARRGLDVRVLTSSDVEGVNAHYLPLLQGGSVPARRASSTFNPALREIVLQLQDSESLRTWADLPSFLQPYTVDFAVEMLVEPPDIVHAWLDLTNIWAGVAAVLAGVPVIILSLRNMSPPRFPYLYQDWFKSWYTLLAATPRVHFINNSLAGARDYAKWLDIPLKRIRVITNGVDFNSLQPPEPEAVAAVRAEFAPTGGRLLLGMFRLSEEKQPMLFFEVARRVLTEFEDLSVVVIGTGPLLEPLARAIQTHGLASRFHILPHRRDIPAVLASADLLLMTSRYEGTPNVVLEAQRLGRTVVGTRSGGTTEAILDRRTGRLCDVDDADGLTRAVRELLADGELRARLGAAGPNFVAARFGLDRMVDETIAFYESCSAAAAATSGTAELRTDATAHVPARSSGAPAGIRSSLRKGAKGLYSRLQHHPRALDLLDRMRRSSWLHPDFAVPGKFRDAVRQPFPDRPMKIGEPLRVTHYIGGLGAGGSERQLCNFAIASAERGITTRVLTAVEPVGTGGHYADELNAAGIHATRAGANRHPLFAQAVESLPSLKLLDPCPPFLQPHLLDVLGEIMMDPPHVLHCWLDLTNIWAGVAGILANVPVIVLSTRSVNPSNFPGIDNPWFRPWYEALAASPRVHFINNSTAGARDYAQWLGLPVTRFEVIRNGVRLSAIERPSAEERRTIRHELGLAADAPVLIGVLRLTEEKQPMLFFEAALEVIKQVPGAHVLLVGSGPFEHQIAEAIAEHGIGQHFRLLGQRRDVYRLMAASDLLLLTSRLEGTPNVLIEAQWMGCPVVTTAAGGAIDALAPGDTGLIVDDRNPAQLCGEVVALMRDRPRLQAMGRAGPAFVAENFAVERMVDETLKFYWRRLELVAKGAASQSNRQQRG